MSNGLKEFVKSIPPADQRHTVNFEEWKASFVNSMSNLIYLIEKDENYNAHWSA